MITVRVLKVDQEDIYYGWRVGSTGQVIEESDETYYVENDHDYACSSWLMKSDVEIIGSF